MTWGLRPRIHGVGLRAGDSGQSSCYCLEPEDSLQAEFLLLQEIAVFALKKKKKFILFYFILAAPTTRRSSWVRDGP